MEQKITKYSFMFDDFVAPGMEPCSFELAGKPVADEQKIRFLDIKVQISDD